jgi:hypothetical protein
VQKLWKGVTLLSHCLKIYERIINLILRRQVENKMREEQYGSRNYRSAVDLIFGGRQILENRWESGKGACLTFIDLEKVCGSTKRQEIWKALHRAAVSKGLMERINCIYDKSENSVVINGKKSESSNV